ncbi:hypothetical protein BFJ63_vAg827 [Fusarium oxysporum f. sp. narcissi]|uniref:Uncharacterized protein n=2 Tax=Fusarium oxysporum TaxID=5507 RepID=A0A4Q2WAJ1_FUSOX|nr:hypothetical protein BFJ65_g9774 [Fusarium oxysporum f. sp. cepae]RKK60135.1 hypothetical protein BFJ66_g1933 [Fusarium oxysporum f. sp. cepae]RKK64049.1 hypothetical protein BFJ67_g692 [Fusarium oxysporum f. sp. cepae]RKL44466.1 hypothetical protein BFJ70_g3608 [Fusarium oxysporum]RYC96464.1 hypothetical protein BFJ63_vAg827 [Fusarium oxysporum f. sp. narcissi]
MAAFTSISGFDPLSSALQVPKASCNLSTITSPPRHGSKECIYECVASSSPTCTSFQIILQITKYY